MNATAVTSTVTPAASRFYQRWLAAAPDRAAKADEITQVSLAGIDLDAYLARDCLLYTSPSPRDGLLSRMPSSA